MAFARNVDPFYLYFCWNPLNPQHSGVIVATLAQTIRNNIFMTESGFQMELWTDHTATIFSGYLFCQANGSWNNHFMAY
jgi:hypothetical protein